MTKQRKLYCIVGPTASGKTAYSLKLAKELDGEVISVDSRQIYRGMDIGTAKEAPRPHFDPDNYEDLWQESYDIAGVPHYLIDICLPSDRYTAFDFKQQAQVLIKQIWARGKTPILAGGTGLYFSALLFDYQPHQGKSSDIEVKATLEQRYQKEGGQALWDQLVKVDPISAAKIHPNNERHLVRALEYYEVTGQPKSVGTDCRSKPVYNAKIIGIDWPRQQLYDRINQRIDQQMEQGLLDEVKTLRGQYPHDLPAMSSLGYQELGDYLDGETDLETALRLFKQHTRNYAKRQLTWFRRYGDWLEWLPAADIAATAN